MTTRQPEAADKKRRGSFVLPDRPEGNPDDMTSFDHLTLSGSVHHVARHLGNPETTIVAGERYLTRASGSPVGDQMAPDLLIAMGADPETYRENNGYIISEQGKPPDFALEIASRSTGRQDVVEKRMAYADLGIPEYWRFDETGEFHGTRLAGDHLVEGQYEPVPIETVEEGVCRGTAMCSTSSSGGTTDIWAGTTRRPGTTSSDTRTSKPAPTMSGRHVWPPRPGSGNWRLTWRGTDRADHFSRRPPKQLW